MSKNGVRGPNAFLRFINRVFCRFWHRLDKTEFTLPEGPVILVGNHISGLDPLLIQAAVDRPLCFLMAREYYRKMRYMRRGFDLVGAIPVNPGGANNHAISEAIRAVQQGNALCMFPEGAANPPIPLHRILPGAAMISRATGAPIIPFRVSGVWPFDHIHIWRSFYRRSRAGIVVGESVALPEAGQSGKTGIRDDTAIIRHAIRALTRLIHESV